MNQLHTITLFGREYRFRSDAGEERAEAVMMQLAEELERVEAEEASQPGPKNETALLLSAALNISHAYVDLKHDYAALTEELKRRTLRLTERLAATGRHGPEQRSTYRDHGRPLSQSVIDK